MFNSEQRILSLIFILLIAFGGLGARLVNLQIYNHDYYEAVAASQRQHASEIAPRRGTIYMRENRNEDLFPVAVDNKAWIAFAVPREIEDPAYVAKELAPALYAYQTRQSEKIEKIMKETGQITNKNTDLNNQPDNPPDKEKEISILEDKLYNKFNQKTDPYEPFLRFYEKLDEEFKRFLEERQLPGIVIQESFARVYPENTLAAHLIGYTGLEDSQKVGRYGIEEHFEETLAGDLGFLSSERDASGNIIGVGANNFQAARDGSDIVLTINRVVQNIIEKTLKEGVEKYQAERGSIIVMEPSSGAVLGMATYPTYDPNYYYGVRHASVQLNPVVSEIFEPGSILKPIIMATAIEEGKVTPNTTFNDTGPVRVDKYTINTFDGKHHGIQTMTQILEQSNNVGMVWVGQQLGAELMYDFLRRFGLGEKTGIELGGETQSTLIPPDEWNVATVATVSFGQGVAPTPLQVLNAINVLANDGSLMRPYLVSSIRHSDGTEEKIEPQKIRRVITSTTANELTAMMVSVIEKGVAGLAKVPGYYLAGKTGTAQVPDEKGKYSPDKKIISFVGYGPSDQPRFSILIKLDNPAGLSFASGTAAPMFSEIAEKLLNYFQVPPDYDPSKSSTTPFQPDQDENRGV